MLKTKAIGLLSLLMLQTSFTNSYNSAESCFPTNKENIPVFDNLRDGEEVTGITEEDFNLVLDELTAVYSEVFDDLGKNFVVNRLWENSQVNASAQQSGDDWIINMYGGLARHKHATIDSFRVVACHELGHHLGGAPIKKTWWGTTSWASNEGQSDYYANFVCMKKLILEGQKGGLELISADLSIYEPEEVAVAEAACSERFDVDEDNDFEDNDFENNYTICVRTSLAGLSLGRLLNGSDDVSLLDRDSSVASKTNHNHPKAQCRADTYFAASLCDAETTVVLDSKDPNLGTCNRADGYEYGLRPLCWFKPEVEGEDENTQEDDGGWWLANAAQETR